MKIQKSQIRQEYLRELASGVDDWQARTNIINSIISPDPEFDNYVGEPGTAEYCFTVQSVWNMCDE